MFLLVAAQFVTVDELLGAARHQAGQLGEAMLGPLVVGKLVLPSCLEVAARLITLSAQALVHRPLVQVETSS